MPNSPRPESPEAPELDARVHAELRAIAERQLRAERRTHTLVPTDLVHEAWLRLAPGSSGAPGASGALGAHAGAPSELSLRARAARAMREVLVDHARRRNALKRAAERNVELAEHDPASPERDAYVVELDSALVELGEVAPDLASVVELRFFGGFSVEETARELGLSPRTVKRRAELAKAWLHRAITEAGRP